ERVRSDQAARMGRGGYLGSADDDGLEGRLGLDRLTMPDDSLRTLRELRDEALAAIADDVFAHDVRLARLAVSVRFDGGVAHVTGEVDDPGQLRLVREVLGRLDGVYAVWDRVRVAGRAPSALDLGCGDRPQYPQNIGVDLRTTAAVRVNADLSRGVPFATASVDRVYAVHVLEHL